MAAPPIADGGVLVEGDRIVAVGPAADLRPRAGRTHHVDGVILPGLADARCRVEHTDAAELAGRGTHRDWVDAVAGYTAGWDDARVSRSAQRGVHALLRAGTTCTGDVVGRGPGVPASSRAGLVGDSRIEIDDVDVHHHDAVLSALERSLGLPAPGRRVGVALPSTAAVGTGVLQAIVALARRKGTPLHLPAAATRDELDAIRAGTGALVARAVQRGREFEWRAGGTGLGPVDYLAACGGLEGATTLAHATWAGDGELDRLARAGVPVVLCPRAANGLRMGPVPLRRLTEAGVALALGTEDPAAVGDLDLLADVAALVARAEEQGLAELPTPAGPRGIAEAAVRLATVDGAAAMGWGEQAGTLAPGRRADLVGVGVEVGADPEQAFDAVARAGAGRQVLTVLAGVRRARRRDPDVAWVEHDPREGEGEGEGRQGGGEGEGA